MKRTKPRSLEDLAKEALAEPDVPGELKRGSYLESWIDPSRRGEPPRVCRRPLVVSYAAISMMSAAA
jgi:hypothetical protein